VSAPLAPHLRVLALALLLLGGVFAAWFADDRHWLASHLVFTLPPLALAIALLAWRSARARLAFWSSVLALGWFSHGVMSAWSHADSAPWSWLEILLAIVIVFAASLPGLRARFGRRRAPR